ncbi:type III secretion system outer membrane ring subunit SctC [Parachitinimonas caeni]|uniref:Type 3 secretion system secretin n=1 Tax=Parachitinimonas caeni TaxID=3031301 RepID=A0ABT7DTZ6_9NEIS|nr:type III secretion system outer membrane ring subunit SctC [Parachitinimonas caeni]MDK2123506.1 type III secretion system outer membrane ring subunit SctC [Parachitinimonas caeni]
MRLHPSVRRLCAPWLLSLAMALPAAAATPPWPMASYSYYADNISLQKLLEDFATQFGVTVQISAAVKGNVNGRIVAASPSEFLNRLSNSYGLMWFYYGGSLYITKSTEIVTKPVSAAGTTLPSLKQALTDLGLVDSRFGWGDLPERGVALVSGPPPYVELIAKAVADLPAIPADENVTVFKLKHATVDDRTMYFRDKQITTPGVATILKNLISGNNAASGTQTQVLELAAALRTAPGLAPNEPAPANGAAAGSAAPSGGSALPAKAMPNGGGGKREPSVQADPRINAIIVRDTPDRLPIYAKLIEHLDVPVSLIEIEAMIVDVNSTKLSELGIDWAGRDGKVAGGFGVVGSGNEKGGITLNRGNGVNPSTILLDSGNFLVSRIKVLEGIGDARVLSRPSILTVDNLGALLDLSETFYIRVAGERAANVVPITTGVSLKVTPHITERDGQKLIQLVIDIEDGAIQEQKIQDLPTVRKSVVSTQAVVGENSSLLIGGYNSTVDVTQDDHVPILGQIPLFGALFSHKKTDRQKRERLFMITPKIVTLPPKN